MNEKTLSHEGIAVIGAYKEQIPMPDFFKTMLPHKKNVMKNIVEIGITITNNTVFNLLAI